jgi:uncharacterized protein YbcV (DUF1398 family)
MFLRKFREFKEEAEEWGVIKWISSIARASDTNIAVGKTNLLVYHFR